MFIIIFDYTSGGVPVSTELGNLVLQVGVKVPQTDKQITAIFARKEEEADEASFEAEALAA